MQSNSIRRSVTRAEFTALTGHVPPSGVIGVCFTNSERTAVVAEFVFIDDEISALEALYQI
jgi:hypothetical protein